MQKKREKKNSILLNFKEARVPHQAQNKDPIKRSSIQIRKKFEFFS
jgi:hypothetical protein